jgi:predicted GIY-YIG superfamily endonuclease
MEVLFTVFALKNPSGLFFVGTAADLNGFLAEADDKVRAWTGQSGPWEVVWQRDGLNKANAGKLETILKREKGTTAFYSRVGLPVPDPIPLAPVVRPKGPRPISGPRPRSE